LVAIASISPSPIAPSQQLSFLPAIALNHDRAIALEPSENRDDRPFDSFKRDRLDFTQPDRSFPTIVISTNNRTLSAWRDRAILVL
jgi:hypothetical protein